MMMLVAKSHDELERAGNSLQPAFRRGIRAIGLAGALSAILVGVPSLRALSPLPPMEGRLSHGSHGYLGINFRDLSDEQVSSLRLKDAHGVEVVLLDHDGPGFRSGLREHDVILQLDGRAVDNEEQLRKKLHGMPAGRTVAFLISRDGLQQTLSAQLANRDTVGQEAWDHHMTVPEPVGPPDTNFHGNSFFDAGSSSKPEVSKHSFLGTTILSSSYTGALLEMMGPQLADYFGSQGGLLVRAVDPNSPAAVAGMRAGDVVLKVNAVQVVSSADWLKTVHENRGKALSIVVLRERKEQILTLTPDAKKRSSVGPHLWPGSKPRPDPTVGMMRPVAWME